MQSFKAIWNHFNQNDTHRFQAGIALVLVVSLLNNLYGIAYGLPYINAPDEPTWMNAAVNILVNKDLNPHEFGHPGSTTIYLLAAVFAAMYLTGSVLGRFHSLDDFYLSYRVNPAPYYLSGRLISVVFSVMAVLLVILIARHIFNRRVGLLAGLLTALSPIYVNYSKLIRTDIQVTFFILVATWFCLNILENQRMKDYVLAGFFSGVAVATKYPAAMIIIILLLAHVLVYRIQMRPLPKLLASGAACLAGLFVSSPYLFLDMQAVVTALAREARLEHLSHTSSGFIQNLVWYLSSPLPQSITWVGMALAALGIYFSLRSRRKGAWLVAAFFGIFITFLSFLNLLWTRWVIPIIPFLAILAASALDEIDHWLRQRTRTWLAALAVTLLFASMLLPLAYADWILGSSMSGGSTRIQAADWIIANVPPGSNVLLESNTSKLPINSFDYYFVQKSGGLFQYQTYDPYERIFTPIGRIGYISDVALLQSQDIQYVVLSNYYPRYKAEQEKYNFVVANYEAIMAMGRLVFQAEPIPGRRKGPSISIYQLP